MLAAEISAANQRHLSAHPDRDIPQQVASQQSLPPLLPANTIYHRDWRVFTIRTPPQCLKKSNILNLRHKMLYGLVVGSCEKRFTGATFKFASTSDGWWSWNSYMHIGVVMADRTCMSCCTLAKLAKGCRF